MAMEGSIVAVLNAAVLPASERGQFALKVQKPFEVVMLGESSKCSLARSLFKVASI